MSASGWSALLTTITSGISITPALSAWIESPEPGISARTIVSAWSTTSISPWPTPTVSSSTSSLPAASISSAACSAASARPPSAPRDAIERMKTPGSRKWSERRIRSPSTAPRVNGLDGSIESTPTSRSALRSSSVSAPISVLLPTPGGPVIPTTRAPAGVREQLGDQLVARGLAVLDQADPARQRPPVAGEQALARGSACGLRARFGHRAAQSRAGPRGYECPHRGPRPLALRSPPTACSTHATRGCSGAICGGAS